MGEGGWVHVRGSRGYGGNARPQGGSIEGRYCELPMGQYSVQGTGRATARFQMEFITNFTNEQKLRGKYCELQMGQYSVQGTGRATARLQKLKEVHKGRCSTEEVSPANARLQLGDREAV